MVPETSDKRTGGALEDPDMEVSGTMDAIVKGTGAGIELLINIVAMLLVLAQLALRPADVGFTLAGALLAAWIAGRRRTPRA